MAEQKINEVETASQLKNNDKLLGITEDGSLTQIEKNKVYPVANRDNNQGIIDRKSSLLYDVYYTNSIVYRALTITTDIIPFDYMIILLDIKDVLTWNYVGNMSVVVKIAVINKKIARINLINNITSGLVQSIYAYFDNNNKLCFTFNFNGYQNISNGVFLANCSFLANPQRWDASNRIITQNETDKYIDKTYTNQIGIILQ